MTAEIIPLRRVTPSIAERDEMQTRAALAYRAAAERLDTFRPAAAKAGLHLSKQPCRAAVELAEHALQLARDIDAAEVGMGTRLLSPEFPGAVRRQARRKPLIFAVPNLGDWDDGAPNGGAA